jgi:hypothetical protein
MILISLEEAHAIRIVYFIKTGQLYKDLRINPRHSKKGVRQIQTIQGDLPGVLGVFYHVMASYSMRMASCSS